MRPSIAVLSAAALLAVALPCTAQNQHQYSKSPLFQPAQRGDMPYIEQYSWLTAGDFDVDGDLDLFVASPYVPSRLLLNDGMGGFCDCTGQRLPAMQHDVPYGGVAAGDIDGDGDLDLLIAHDDLNASSGTVNLWINDGRGFFTDQSFFRIPAIQARTITLFDVDSDGDLDILLGRNGKQNMLLVNTGQGMFFDATGTNMPIDKNFAWCVDTGDVDGDGDIDFIVGTWSAAKPKAQSDVLYLNDGAGKFSITANFPAQLMETRGAKFFDWDGDGDLDYIAGCGHQYAPDKDVLFINDGAGVFSIDTTGMLPVVMSGSRSYVSGDFDNDNLVDLYLPGMDGRILFNNSAGNFTDKSATHLPADVNRNRSAVVGDMNGDGNLDLVVTSGNQIRLFLNDGLGVFSTKIDTWFPFHQACAESVAMSDVDGDGDLDIIVASYPIYPTTLWNNKIYINDGRGRFVEETSTRFPKDTLPSCCVVIFDVDGDKDMDIVFGNEGVAASLYINDGKGVFVDKTVANMPTPKPYTYGIKAADFDSDGDIDLVLANWGSDSLYLNDGKGVFTDASAAFPSKGSSRGIVVGDLDGDGDLDVVIGHGFYDTDSNGVVILRPNGIMLNNGKAGFTPAPAGSWPANGADETLELAIGDVDGDGDLDLYESTGILLERYDNLYLNDGKAKFTKAPSGMLPGIPGDRAFACLMRDFDGDGDLDIYAGKSDYVADFGAQNRLYLNNGKGRFSDATNLLPVSMDHTNYLAAGDIDGDGDLDVIGASFYEPQLYLNRTHQIWAPKIPYHTDQWTLTITSRPSAAQRNFWVVPFVGSSIPGFSIPGFGGEIGVGNPIILGVFLTKPRSSVTLTLPAGVLLSMKGKRFYTQALVENQKGWYFTGVLEEIVR